MKLSSRARKVVLTIHIATAVAVLGADGALLVLGLAALGGGSGAALYPAALLIGERVIAPLAIGAILSGLTLALFGPYGLLRYWWVPLKLAITGALSAAVLTVLLPALRAAADAGVRGASVAQRVPLAVAPIAAISLLLVAVALAVFKPAWRLRRA